ncbi:MAG: FecCD family ABC transporter permease [Roseovarius sp.]
MIRNVFFLFAVLGVSLIVSLHLGHSTFSPATVWAALNGAEGTDAQIIRALRLPRTLIGACVGATLALSGMLMQIATRNPLAEPGLLGVNAGAGLAVTLGVAAFGVAGLIPVGLLAFAGALAATAIVFGISFMAGGAGQSGTTLLAGVTVAALLASLTQVILLLDESAIEKLLFWLSGSFADRDLQLFKLGIPALAFGFAACGIMARPLDALRLGDQTARALGVAVTRVRLGALVTAAALAGGAVAMAGPVIFVGLVAPHLARQMSANGAGTFRLACLSALLGSLLAVNADILARIIVAPGEAPVGAVLALVGVPALIGLMRRRERPV